MSNPKRVTDMQKQAPFVDASVSPQALAYARSMADRRYQEPVAGGPTPPIPRLDMPHHEGPPMTMADHARAQRGIAQHPQPPLPPMIEASAPQTPPAPYLLPTDTLPPEARQDPAYLPGMGSGYASAQPELARKYGVVRNGQHVPPQMLGSPASAERPQAGRLRQETIAGLQKIGEAQQRAAAAEAETGSKDSPAGAATRIGMPGGGEPSTERALSPEELRKALSQLDEFDINQLHHMMVKDLLNNEEQRKIIEERLEPLSLADLVSQGFVVQRVPIIPGEFEPSFRSLGGHEDLACKRLVMEEARTLQSVEDPYLLDKYAFMGLTCALYALNGKPIPDHLDENGKFNEELFWKKFNHVMRLPLPLLASLGVNYFWFDVRVRKLFVAKNVKNG